MTVLALKASRRANAVSSLHGHVSREMWMPLHPGLREDQVPIGHITNGVHVSTLAGAADAPGLRAPPRRRLDDAQHAAGSLARHRERRRRRVVGDASDAQGAADRLHAAARRAAGGAARRAGRGRRAASPRAQPRRADDRLRAAVRHLQAGEPDAAGPRGARQAGEPPADAGAVHLRRQGPSRATCRARPCCSRSPA